MKGSITKRLFAEIVLVVLSFSALILLSNTLLLKPLYYYSIRKTMTSAMEQLSRIDFGGDPSAWTASIEEINGGGAYDVIVQQDGAILYSSSSVIGLQRPPRNSDQWFSGEQRPDMNTDFIRSFRTMQQWNLSEGGILTDILEDPRSGDQYMVSVSEPESGTVLYLTQAIEPINQSVNQSNILLIACTALFLAASVALAFRISKRFTQPIKLIRGRVGEITRLNFGGQCAVRTGDELQELSQDINRLSDTLESALRTLRQQNVQLEKDMVSQRKFISNASHELRTPLALIKGYSDEINAGFITDPAQQQFYMRIIGEESAKMNRLLKEILDLFRLESGRMELRRERLPVPERITAFVEKYHGFITDNGLNVTLELEPGGEGVFDAMRFEQILANYISNAAKYGDAGKRVVISSRTLERAVRVRVFNSGRPICEDVLPHIWDGFYKADDARTRVEGSYGLGLSIVKAIQTVAGQEFGVENADGGVIFWFDVERADA